jgi:hypothetical protein
MRPATSILAVLNCYAETMSARNPTLLGQWGPEGKRIVAPPKYWDQLYRWNADAEAAGEVRRVFSMSLADMFEDWPGPVFDHQGGRLQYTPDAGLHRSYLAGRDATLDHVRAEVFEVTRQLPWLRFLCLTKRPQNVPIMLQRAGRHRLPGNWWLGTSVSDQRTLENYWGALCQHAGDLCLTKFISAEPLLGHLNFDRAFDDLPKPDWIIIGGESGHRRRDCGIDAIVSAVAQCEKLGIPCYVKQDCHRLPGQQGRIPEGVWSMKHFPKPRTA